MNRFESDIVQDEYFLNLKKSKDVAAVVKVDFATFASAIPDELKIFVYEGVADKKIYYHWIKRLRPGLPYEPYVCKNKNKVLQLFDVLESDLTGLGERTYYFVDQDFDGLQGRELNHKIFVTDRYSIENYVVTSTVLDDLLTVDFHCEGHPLVRDSVRNMFEQVYEQFLGITADINFRIFIARKNAIAQIEDLPDRINSLACVELTKVTQTESSAVDIVKLEREPTEDEFQSLRQEFEAINPKNDFRGKFALLFFIRWLSLLRTDRLSPAPVLFSSLPKTEFSVNGSFTLESLSPKAPAPEGLSAFLLAI